MLVAFDVTAFRVAMFARVWTVKFVTLAFVILADAKFEFVKDAIETLRDDILAWVATLRLATFTV
jgi:hypothetical protein